MRFKQTSLLAGLFALTVAISAQTVPGQSAGGQSAGSAGEPIPRVELALGYTYLHANAPPGSCGCFSLNGGSGAAAVNFPYGLGIVGDVSTAHASSVNGTSQNLIVLNYLFGLRYSWRGHSRAFTPYGQFLLGGSTEYSNKTPVQNTSAFAFSTGGGVNARLTRRLGWNIAEADWVHSQLPNGGNARQNDLSISSGVILRF
jgi:outer membrane immunogenic protein